MKMHQTAINFALRHKINLCRYGAGWGSREGHYYIGPIGQAGWPAYLSNGTTAQAALRMMRRYVRQQKAA